MCLKKINVNPAKRITEDSYVRAICMGLDISYKDAFRGLADFSLSQSLSMTDCRAFKSFLKTLGYYEQKMQNYCNVEMFVNKYEETGKNYILKIGKNSATVVKNKTVFDNYANNKKSVSGYWIIK